MVNFDDLNLTNRRVYQWCAANKIDFGYFHPNRRTDEISVEWLEADLKNALVSEAAPKGAPVEFFYLIRHLVNNHDLKPVATLLKQEWEIYLRGKANA